MVKIFYRNEMVAETTSSSPSHGKPEKVVNCWRSKFRSIEVLEPVPATFEQLCLAHDREYVEGCCPAS